MPACPNCGKENPEGFRFCPHCAAPLAGAAQVQEERKLVTVLFADVTGSTALGERLDPERLRSLLDTFFSAMAGIIESWGGTVEKFIGDAVMAVFGVPVVREDDAQRALRASLDMLARLEDLNREFDERHGVTVRIRIGVNTGEVIAPEGKPTGQMLVIGDAVNVAARLEQAAEPGTVLVGERTYVATRSAFRFDEPLALELKGKAEPVSVRRLAGPLPESVRGVPGLRSAMVGRDRELDTLLSMLDEAIESRRPRLVVVNGPAGIGKSRLVQEFVEKVPTLHPETVVLRGRCPAAGRGITYWALGEILRSACGVALDDPVQVASDKLRARVREILSALPLREPEVEHTVFALATTARIQLPDNPLERIEPRAVADELSQAWPRFASAFAARAPTILVIEDLHWAEDRLLEMLERVLARSSGPLVLVTTARPQFAEARPAFAAGREDVASISLRPLTGDQSGELMDGLLAVADLPEDLREEMLAKAEGNPFFLEEIVRRLIDEGALVQEGDRWRATEAARGVALPDTIHGLLAARIDALPREEKRALQEAAVVGKVFWEEPVARSLPEGEVSSALLGLERKGLIFVRPTSTIAGQVEFAFKHALVRDVAYASLPLARRARAHAEHAAWIEQLAGDRVEEFAERLAHHYATAVAEEAADLAWATDPVAREAVTARASAALLLAGNVARRRFAIDTAVDLHQQALTLAASEAQRARALEEMGDDHAAAFHGDEALEAYQGALDIVRKVPEASEVRARLCRKAARMSAEKSGTFRRQPDPAAVEALVREGLEVASDREERGWLLGVLGTCAIYWRSFAGHDPVRLQERIDATQEALAIGDALGVPELLTLAARTLSELYGSLGSYQLAVDTSRRQLAVVDQIDSPAEQALIFFEVANTLMDLAGAYAEGLDLGRRSYELGRTMSPHELMHGTFCLMNGLYHLGSWPETLTFLDEHVAAFRLEGKVRCYAVQGGPLLGAITLVNRGELERAHEIAAMVPLDPRPRSRFEGLHARFALEAGDPETARRLAHEAMDRTEYWRAPEAVHTLLDALAAQRDWPGLDEFIGRIGTLADDIPPIRAARDRAQGLLRAEAGDTKGARTSLGRAVDRFEGLSMVLDAARTREALAAVVPPDEGSVLLRQALGTYERLGAKPHATRVRAGLGADS